MSAATDDPVACFVCGRHATAEVPLVSLWFGAWSPRRVCVVHFTEVIASAVHAANRNQDSESPLGHRGD